MFGVKSVKKLMKIYYGSVGSNCLLILNIPPDKSGRLCSRDVARREKMGEWLKKEADSVIASAFRQTSDFEYTVTFEEQSVDRIRLSEDTTKSQRVEEFSVFANGKCVYKGTVIGFSKIAIFAESVQTSAITVKIDKCREKPHLKKFEVCKTGAYRI